MSEYVSLSTIIENPVTEMKSELEELNVFSAINEGDEVYPGSGVWAQVFPGMDRITLDANQQLHHRFEVYINILQGASDTSLPDLRAASHQAFDKLLEDTSHNGSCWKSIPVSWRPGLYARGEYVFSGVQCIWEVENWQTFPLPTHVGATYSDMSSVVETIIDQVKDEISALPDIDVLTEGERLYDYEGTFAYVIPGEDQIDSSNIRRLEHVLTIYQNLLTMSGTTTLSEMREIGETVYDTLMSDITHLGICNYLLPAIWHPGLLRIGDIRYVGIYSEWRASMLHSYTPT